MIYMILNCKDQTFPRVYMLRTKQPCVQKVHFNRRSHGWRGGSIIEPCESTMQAEKSRVIERHVCKVRFPRFHWRSGKVVDPRFSCNGPIVARRDCGINVVFTCSCDLYLFLFPILRECTLVKCHCGMFIELASSTEPKKSTPPPCKILPACQIRPAWKI